MLPAYLFTQPSLITGHPAVTTRGRTINLKRIQTKYQSESQGRGEGDDMTDYGREKKQHLVKIWEQLESVTGTGWSFPWLLTIPALLYDGGSFFNVRTEQWQSAQSVVLYFQCLVWSSDWEDRYIFSHFAGLLSHSHPALARNVQKFWSEKRRGAWDHPGNQGPRPESSNEGVAVWLFSLSSRQIIGLHFSVGKQINNGKYQQSGRYLFWLSRLKLTKYWPLSLNRICMGDILSNTSWGRRAERVIILWSFCSLLTGLLREDAWKIIHDENVQ